MKNCNCDIIDAHTLSEFIECLSSFLLKLFESNPMQANIKARGPSKRVRQNHVNGNPYNNFLILEVTARISSDRSVKLHVS